jgi:hypothetical protein
MSITAHLRSASGRAVRVTRVDGLARWHVRSQEVARRNAMVSMTELTQRRVEREEVEEFLARHRQRYDAVG